MNQLYACTLEAVKKLTDELPEYRGKISEVAKNMFILGIDTINHFTKEEEKEIICYVMSLKETKD